MIAHVVPALRLPRSRWWFDYAIPEALVPSLNEGDFVTIPFRQRTIRGFVWRIDDSGEIDPARLRPVIDRLTDHGNLNRSQRDFFSWIAERYAVSVATLLKPLAVLGAKTVPERMPAVHPEMQIQLPSWLAQASPGSMTVAIYHRQQTRQKLLRECWTLRPGPVAVVVPTLMRLDDIIPHLPADAAILHHRQTAKQRSEQLRRLPTARLIVGTRTVLLTPLPRLQALVLDDEENEQHKQTEQQPRISDLHLAHALADRQQIPVIALSAAPSLAAYGLVRARERPFLELDHEPSPSVRLLPPTARVSKKKLSKAIIDELAAALSQGERIFVFFNRRGLNRHLTCAECGWIARCPDCQVTLVRHDDELRCHTCGRSESLPRVCPACQSHRLDALFPGTAGLAQQLTKLFGTAVQRIDRDVKTRTVGAAPLLIGTEYALPVLGVHRPSRIIVLGFDQLFAIPSARATERAFHVLRALASIDSVRTMTIETRYPKHPLFQTFAKQDLEGFYQHEWSLRERYQLPPAIPAVYFESPVATEAARVALNTWLRGQKIPIERLRGPLTIRRGKRQLTRVWLQGTPERLFAPGALTRLPESWIIDPDPLD